MNQPYYHLGLTGCPLAKSKSPELHNAALQAAGLDGEYRLYRIEPGDQAQLAAIIQRLREPDHERVLHGLNVTIPHKQAVIPLLDSLTSTAQAIGAVNTVLYQSGKLVGDNTDAPGFLSDLKRLTYPELNTAPGHALVLGAGGSARAVVYALLQDGWAVSIAARRIEQAQQLGASLEKTVQHAQVEGVNLTATALAEIAKPDLVVNTTPVGMIPDITATPWPDDLPFPHLSMVYDLIYKPLETHLMRQAKLAGLTAFNGLGMLVEQAALSFERWTGVNANRKVMWEAVRDA